MPRGNIVETVNEIIYLYERYGDADYIGEPVSQIEHMCQCAQLAEASGADDETVLAAFLHDIGHLYEFAYPEKKLPHMADIGLSDHEKLGAAYLLSKGFSQKIADIVQSHVPAKRYLTYAFPEYYNQLSEASKKTMEFQGGIMTREEANAFEANDLFNIYISMRRWDDKAKEAGLGLPSLEHYKQLMTAHLCAQNN